MEKENNQEIYIGMYRDDKNECRLDGSSSSDTMFRAVEKFYQNMMDEGIVDGFNADKDTGEQLEELNDSECDMVTVDKSTVENILQQL